MNYRPRVMKLLLSDVVTIFFINSMRPRKKERIAAKHPTVCIRRAWVVRIKKIGTSLCFLGSFDTLTLLPNDQVLARIGPSSALLMLLCCFFFLIWCCAFDCAALFRQFTDS